MPKTTFILVTILFGVICGNRLMDKRLLRSAPTSYELPFKTIGDANVNSLNGQINDEVELKSRSDKTLNSVYFPYENRIDFERNLTARNCNKNLIVNLLKQSSNYGAYDVIDDKLNNINGIKSYQAVGDFEYDDILDMEHVESAAINSKSKQSIQPKLNMFPQANYKDFYQDLVVETTKKELTKRNGNPLALALGSSPPRGCDCKMKNDFLDLGQQHFPRYLFTAVCHSNLGPTCWSGSVCRPLNYKVQVLTFRSPMDNMQNDPTLSGLPDDLRQRWKFRTVSVTVGCFCS